MKISNRHIEFFGLLVLLLLTRITDGILTYSFTPDLSRELNPLVSIFGFKWAGLIMAALVIIVPMEILSYYSIYKPFDNFPENEVSFSDFKKYYFNKSNPKTKSDGLKIIRQAMGYIMPRVFIFWGIWIIIHNSLVLMNQPFYQYLRTEYKIWMIGYLLPAVLGSIFYNQFLKREYKRFINKKINL